MLDTPIDITAGNGRKIALLHGFTQSAEVWRRTADVLFDLGYDVVAPNLPGHGPNPAFDRAGLTESARLVIEACGPAVYVGYSLGARVLLHALSRPEVQGAISIGGRLGFATDDEAAARSASDEAQAGQIETLGVTAFVESWLALPFNARVPDSRQFREARLTNRPEGLAASLRCCGLGVQRLVLPDTTDLLVLRGEFDMADVKSETTRIADDVKGSQLLTVPGVGHSIPFELEPVEFATIVDDYARQTR